MSSNIKTVYKNHLPLYKFYYIIIFMKKFFAIIEKYAIPVLIIIGVLTVFFLFKTFKIGLNASYSAFMPWGETNKTFYGGLEGQIPDFGIDERKIPEIIESAFSVADGIDTSIKPNVYNDLKKEVINNYDFESMEEPSNEGDSSHGAGTLLVLIEGKDLYTADSLNLIQYCINKFISRSDVGSSYSVLDFITLEAKGRRLSFVPMSPNKDSYWTEEEAATLGKRLELDPIVNYFLIGGDGNSMMFEFPITSYNSNIEKEFRDVFAPLEEYGLNVFFNGGPVINFKVMDYLQKDLSTLLILCILAILITYFLSFRSKRSVLIPGSLSIIGLVWTLGTMSMMGIDITILNIVTPCMVITLGSSYSIHVISEYYSHFRKDGSSELSPVQSTNKIMGTIILACLTTIAGFLCLCVSQTDGLREFGISVSIGIFYCALLACIYLPAILTVVPAPKDKSLRKYGNDILSRFVRVLARIVPKYWYVFIIILALLCLGFVLVKDEIGIDSNYMSYFPESDTFGQESRAFAKAMGGTNPFVITITAPEGSTNYFLKHENLKAVREYEEAILSCSDVLQSISFSNYVAFANSLVGGEYEIPDSDGLINMLSRMVTSLKKQGISGISQVISDDFNSVTLNIQHWDSVEQDLMTTTSIIRAYSTMVDNLDLLPEGTIVAIDGDPVVNVKFSNRLLSDQNISTILSVLIVFAFASFTFLSPFRGIITLIPVLAGIMINYIFMYFMGIPFDMVTVSFSSIAVGCGVDDALHFMLRYSNKRKEGIIGADAIEETMKETGRPIILTTISIVFGMMMLSFASYTPIRYFGLLMSITLFGCMVSTLIFLPPFAIAFNKIGTLLRKKIK